MERCSDGVEDQGAEERYEFKNRLMFTCCTTSKCTTRSLLEPTLGSRHERGGTLAARSCGGTVAARVAFAASAGEKPLWNRRGVPPEHG